MGYEQMEGFRAVGIVAADSGLWNYEFDEDDAYNMECEYAQRMYEKEKQEDEARLKAWNEKNGNK